jgi:hypothetical protein
VAGSNPSELPEPFDDAKPFSTNILGKSYKHRMPYFQGITMTCLPLNLVMLA